MWQTGVHMGLRRAKAARLKSELQLSIVKVPDRTGAAMGQAGRLEHA